MKHLTLFVVCLSFLSFVNAQQFSVPEITPEQEREILYNNLIAYNALGVAFVKTKGTTPKEYGEYIGNQFKSFWNPDDGFPAFANGMMRILGGIHPNNEMQIVEQSEKMIRFKMKNVDLLFKYGTAFGITYEEFLEAVKLGITAGHIRDNYSTQIDASELRPGDTFNSGGHTQLYIGEGTTNSPYKIAQASGLYYGKNHDDTKVSPPTIGNRTAWTYSYRLNFFLNIPQTQTIELLQRRSNYRLLTPLIK